MLFPPAFYPHLRSKGCHVMYIGPTSPIIHIYSIIFLGSENIWWKNCNNMIHYDLFSSFSLLTLLVLSLIIYTHIERERERFNIGLLGTLLHCLLPSIRLYFVKTSFFLFFFFVILLVLLCDKSPKYKQQAYVSFLKNKKKIFLFYFC